MSSLSLKLQKIANLSKILAVDEPQRNSGSIGHQLHSLKKRAKRMRRTSRNVENTIGGRINQYLRKFDELPIENIYLNENDRYLIASRERNYRDGITEREMERIECDGCAFCGTLELMEPASYEILVYLRKFMNTFQKFINRSNKLINFRIDETTDIEILANHCGNLISCRNDRYNNLDEYLYKTIHRIESLFDSDANANSDTKLALFNYTRYKTVIIEECINVRAIKVLKYILMSDRCGKCETCSCYLRTEMCIKTMVDYFSYLIERGLDDLMPLFNNQVFINKNWNKVILINYRKLNLIKLFSDHLPFKDNADELIVASLRIADIPIYEYIMEKCATFADFHVNPLNFPSLTIVSYNGNKSMIDTYFKFVRKSSMSDAELYDRIKNAFYNAFERDYWTDKLIDNLTYIISYMDFEAPHTLYLLICKAFEPSYNFVRLKTIEFKMMDDVGAQKAYEFIDILVKKKLMPIKLCPASYREYIAKPWPTNRPTPPSVMTFLLAYQRQANAGLLPFLDPYMMREMLANIPYRYLVD